MQYSVVETTEVEEEAEMKFGAAGEKVEDVISRILGYRLVPKRPGEPK
jgi:hypothetical protein